MELRHLRYFVAVARELNFTKASQALHTAQPSLSQQVKQLEEDIGATLFYRNTHEVRLTKAGAVLYQRAEDILRQVDEAACLTRKASKEESRQVTIGLNAAAEIKVLPRILEAVGREPSINLAIESHQTAEQIPLLRNGRLDAAFMRAPDSPSADIHFETVLCESIVVVLPMDHELAKHKAIPIGALKSMPYVAATTPAILRAVTKFCSRAGVKFTPVQFAENVLANLNLVSAGVGFSLVPDYVEAILPRNVVIRPVQSESPPKLPLMVAYRKENQLPALKIFRRILRNSFPAYGHT